MNDEEILNELCQPEWPNLSPAIDRGEFDLKANILRLRLRHGLTKLEKKVINMLCMQCGVYSHNGKDIK